MLGAGGLALKAMSAERTSCQTRLVWMKHSTKEAKIDRYFASQRQRMVRRQLKARGIRDKDVIRAMQEVPRERFVPDSLREFAYDDAPLPIGEAQTISQPFIVALMIEAAALTPRSRVLEIGAGSGYAAAVMAQLAAEVFAVEWNVNLAEQVEARLQALGYLNTHFRAGDGSYGWPEQAPFNAILVSAGMPVRPNALVDQLTVGGRLIVPVADGEDTQRLLLIRKGPGDDITEEDLGSVRFVPLMGAQGYQVA